MCWCLCKCFQKGQESESIELQDIERGNDQRSHIRQSGLSQNEPQEERGPPILILTPLRNESKNIIVEPKNLNKLHLNVIEKNYMQTPIELFSKHVVYGKITEEKAIQLSNKRGKWFAEYIIENTVFENPNQFHLGSIERLHLLDAKSNQVYVPERRVRTFQCRYNPNLEDYTIKDIGMKSLFWRCVTMENIIFYRTAWIMML